MPIEVFTTVRRIEGVQSYYESLQALMKINENFDFDGILFFENHSNNIDPWIFSQDLLTKSSRQTPFIAVNPVYQHPYSVALKIASFSCMFQKKIYINFIAGTSVSDLNSLGDYLSHTERYERLSEYIHIVKNLLSSRRPFSFQGKYYQISNLMLSETLPKEHNPGFFISGSSANAAVSMQAECKRISMGKPPEKIKNMEVGGLCFGIVARETTGEAESIFAAHYQPAFPEYEDVMEYSMKNTDAKWKNELLHETDSGVFRMNAFKNFVSDSPYLVGSYDEVREYISLCIHQGITTFIIECDEREAEFINRVFNGLKKYF
jgi:alkanesulfonate monooxygenase